LRLFRPATGCLPASTVVTRATGGIAALLERAAGSGERPVGNDTSDLAERVHTVVDGYLLHTAASGDVTTARVERQFRTTLTGLLGPP
jgi:hypothetical protein